MKSRNEIRWIEDNGSGVPDGREWRQWRFGGIPDDVYEQIRCLLDETHLRTVRLAGGLLFVNEYPGRFDPGGFEIVRDLSRDAVSGVKLTRSKQKPTKF